MKGNRSAERGKGAIEILEEAVHLLRMAPSSLLAIYYVGSLPFILGLLYFWADMSRGAFAAKHCVEASLALTFLYLWMKSWQAVFSSQLKARLAGEESPSWTGRRVARLVLAQAIYQPYSLIALPIGMMVTLPFGWLYAFYQNLSVVGDGSEGGDH